jgi:hypothetical protein
MLNREVFNENRNDDIDFLLFSLNDTDPPTPRVHVGQLLYRLRQEQENSRRNKGWWGLRLGVPVGALATVTVFFMVLNLVLHTPSVSPTFSPFTNNPEVGATVTAPVQNNGTIISRTEAPGRQDMLRINVQVAPGAGVTIAPVPAVTPGNVRGAP